MDLGNVKYLSISKIMTRMNYKYSYLFNYCDPFKVKNNLRHSFLYTTCIICNDNIPFAIHIQNVHRPIIYQTKGFSVDFVSMLYVRVVRN